MSGKLSALRLHCRPHHTGKPNEDERSKNLKNVPAVFSGGFYNSSNCPLQLMLCLRLDQNDCELYFRPVGCKPWNDRSMGWML